MRLGGSFLLLLAAFFWGTTFVAQSVGMEDIGPYTYGAARYVVAVPVVLLIWLLFRGRREAAKAAGAYQAGWKSGLGAGAIMLAATTLQQVGMQYTTVGKAAFITCLYLVFVPLVTLLIQKRGELLTWGGAFLALAGLYFLCVSGEGGFSLAAGDSLMLVSSFFWTMHILYIDRFAALVDAIELSAAQLFVCACGSLVLTFFLEEPQAAGIWGAWAPILYAGVMSSGVAFTLQIVGQQYTDAALAAVIMSLEAVIGALAGVLLLGERMDAAELFGCALMLSGMLFAQLAALRKGRRADIS